MLLIFKELLQVIYLKNSNEVFDTWPPVIFIYVALARFSISLLESENDHTYWGGTHLDKPSTPSNWGVQLHGENISALIVLLRKIDGRTNKCISLQLKRPFELLREVSDERLTLETWALLSFYAAIWPWSWSTFLMPFFCFTSLTTRHRFFGN